MAIAVIDLLLEATRLVRVMYDRHPEQGGPLLDVLIGKQMVAKSILTLAHAEGRDVSEDELNLIQQGNDETEKALAAALSDERD